MTNVRRPINLHLRSPTSTPQIGSPKALSPVADSLPSQILPHLFVGNQEQTNRETVNRLSISYILSLGLLPLISASCSPTSPTAGQQQQQQQQHATSYNSSKYQSHNNHHHQISMPSRNSSKDFKIRIRTNAATPQTPQSSIIASTTATRDENKGVVNNKIRWIQCKCINIADSSEQMLSKFFDEAHQFIDEARRRKCNILVHCQAGISRSPTIAIAYLMKVNSLPLQEAYNLVKQCRPQTDPNLSFMGQLMIYEKSLEAADGSSSSSLETKQQTRQQQQHQQRKSVRKDTK